MNKTNVSDWKVRETSEEKQIYPETPLKLTQKIESQGFSAKSRPIRHFLLAKANKTIDRLLDSNGHTLRVFHARAGFKARIACHDLPMLINSTRVIQLMNQDSMPRSTNAHQLDSSDSTNESTKYHLYHKREWTKNDMVQAHINNARADIEQSSSEWREPPEQDVIQWGNESWTNRDDSRNGVRPITQDASQVTPPPNYPWLTNKDSNECSQFIHSSNPTTDQFSTILIF